MTAMRDEPLTSHPPQAEDDELQEIVFLPGVTLSLQITLDREESRLLSAAASAANVSTNRYIKQAALAAAQHYQDEHAPRDE